MDKDIKYSIYRLSIDDLNCKELAELVRLQEEHIKTLEKQVVFLNNAVRTR